jgi:dTDP-L-rhamnose 4-epimerase
VKVIITGGLGFIGTALATRLLSEGHAVTLVDSLSTQIHGDVPEVAVPLGATVCRFDVRDAARRSEVFEGAEAVVHLAAETGTGQSMYRIEEYVDVNERGLAAVLAAIAGCRKRPERVVLSSSRSVYGEGAYRRADGLGELIQPLPRTKEQLSQGQWDHALDGRRLEAIATPETLAFLPGSVYAATKAAQELLLFSASTALGFRPVILRLQNVYGEGQSLRNPYTGIISIFFNRARQGLEIPLYEDGIESRDFVHISDVVSAFSLALTADVPAGHAINIGSGVPSSVSELAETLIRVSGHHVPVQVTGQFRVGDIRHCYADLQRAQSLLGFSPKVTLSQGLERFCAWAREQPVHQDQSARATEELRKSGLGT